MKYSNLHKRVEKLTPKPPIEWECTVIWGSYESDCGIKQAHGEPVLTREEYEAHKAVAVGWNSDEDEQRLATIRGCRYEGV